jgi:hypothetical protein
MPASSAIKIRKFGSFLDRSLTSAEHNEIENVKRMNEYRSFRTMLLYMTNSIIFKRSESRWMQVDVFINLSIQHRFLGRNNKKNGVLKIYFFTLIKAGIP